MFDLKTLGPNICLSGGAIGADLQWGMCAGTLGHSVIHWGFKGHKSDAPNQEIVLLTEEQLEIADEYCIKANRTLKRHYPPKSPFVRNLLRRDYYQVAWNDSVYAISTLVDGMAQGGTAWAVQMFLDSHNNEPCPCYVFCQEQCHWFEWQGNWVPIYEPPIPSGIYAGIGSRDLLFNGKLAIRVLMNYKKIREYRTREKPVPHFSFLTAW